MIRPFARRVLKVSAGLAGLGVLAVAVAIHIPIAPAVLAPAAASSLVLTDRHGEILRTLPLRGGGRALWTPLAQIPSSVVLVTLAGEDERFLDHSGVDPWAVLRAVWLNLKYARVTSGASTISMQLARLLHPRPRTIWAKAIETLTALRLERSLGKDQLLEHYLNRTYYGHGAFGIEAAARTYFGKPAALLTASEGSFLAVLPRAPTAYDPRFRRSAALTRRSDILALLQKRGLLSAQDVADIEAAPIELAPSSTSGPEAGHFADWILASMTPEERQRGGVRQTTLDLQLQRQVQRAVTEHLERRRENGLPQAGVVILDPSTGAVRAMVGSADYSDPTDGQLNISIIPRHPGSALKPFVYALALARGDSPATIANDVATVPSDWKPDRPLREHGPVRYREALANSYNLAAVHTLERVGTMRFVDLLKHAQLIPQGTAAETFGPALALGAAKVRLIDLAAAFGFLVNGGTMNPPVGLIDSLGARPAVRLFSPEVSWLVMDMLADPQARRAAFGAQLPVDLPFRAAVKTGTSSGYSDTVAVGATREAIVAAWAGAFDGSGTRGALAMWSAAPLVRAGLLAVANGQALTLPARPETLITADICPLSGMKPGPLCPHKQEHFIPDTQPQSECSWHRGEAGTVELRAALPAELRNFRPPRLRVVAADPLNPYFE